MGSSITTALWDEAGSAGREYLEHPAYNPEAMKRQHVETPHFFLVTSAANTHFSNNSCLHKNTSTEKCSYFID
jgi:hypothetical protein